MSGCVLISFIHDPRYILADLATTQKGGECNPHTDEDRPHRSRPLPKYCKSPGLSNKTMSMWARVGNPKTCSTTVHCTFEDSRRVSLGENQDFVRLLDTRKGR
ncbi:hypothetical protein CJF30_00010838 [Rutstroemia sp. NJR-2017a BBW]|nr:hypothetical protein CJF30_00010838 [Rutstroemia sp. NJR-2017a BBW]